MIKADLHIHTVLSPCGDIEMTPAFIVRRAKEAGLGIIAVTDHNSTRQAPVVAAVGQREGVFVISGAEINTREEVHVLALVPDEPSRLELQDYLDTQLMRVPNKPEVFGYQLMVNEEEEVLYEEESLLINSIDQSLDEVERFVHSIGGIFIPAHIDKQVNSLISQLGYVPPGLKADALEVSARCDAPLFLSRSPYLDKFNIIRNSDAHYPDDFGKTFTLLDLDTPSFEGLKEALSRNPLI